jgi:alpha-galactosidase
MAVFYNEEIKQFVLSTDNTSLVFYVSETDYIINLYYGKKLSEKGDYRHLWYSDPVFAPQIEGNSGSKFSPYEMPSEYPSYGRGDYHEAAFGVEFFDGSRLIDPVFESFKILKGTPEPQGLPGLSGGDETLVITLRDRATGLKIDLYYCIFEKNDIIGRYAEIINETEKPLSITRALSLNLDLPTSQYDMISFYGYHLEECQLERLRLHHGVQSVGSRRGASGHSHNPAMILATPETGERGGEAYAMALCYSGNFIARTEVDGYGRARAQIGIHPDDFNWVLEPSEKFTTPEAVMTYTDKGLNALSHNFHNVIRNNLGHTKRKDMHRPIVINNWEATYFDFDEEKILEIIRSCKGLGIDTFVLDDGWFGSEKEVRDDDTTSLGDWFVAENKLPRGLTPLIEECEKQGMGFGLWFEPEMISEESELYRNHPDWAIGKPGRPKARGRNQLILDITREDVYNYIETRLITILSENRISYVKWDMNRNMSDAYSALLPPEKQPEIFHRYMLQFYRLLRTLTEKFPDLIIEGCSGGGGRFDMGNLYFCPQIWTSDDSDAIERLRIQYGTSMIYPPISMTAHVSACPNHQTNRISPFETREAVAMSASFGYELNPLNLPEDDRGKIASQVKTYRENTDLLEKGDFYRLENPFNKPYSAWMFVSEDKKKARATFVQQLYRPRLRAVIKLMGLLEDTKYLITNDKGEEIGVFGGDELMFAGISFEPKSDFEAMVINIRKI